MAKKKWLAKIAVFVAVVFSSTTAIVDPSVFAQSIEVGLFRNSQEIFEPVLPFEIPAELGKVKGYFNPLTLADDESVSSMPFVIHIQDAHANPDAQYKISSILFHIYQNIQADVQNPLLVALEGAQDAIHPEYLNFFPEFPGVNQAIVRDLAAKGEITGAELFAWEAYQNKDRSARIIGVETPEIYRENLYRYRSLLVKRDEIEGMLAPLRNGLEIVQSRILSPDLKSFIRERQRRKYGNYGTGMNQPQYAAYLIYLAAQLNRRLGINLSDPIEQIRFPNLVRVLAMDQLEKDFDPRQVDEVRHELLGKLEKLARTREERDLVRDSARLETLKNPRAYCEALWRFAEHRGISLSGYRDFLQWAGLVILRSEIDSEGLFEEVELLEGWLFGKLIKTDDEKKLVLLLDDFAHLEKLLRLELTREEYVRVREKRNRIMPRSILKRLDGLLGRHSEFRRQCRHPEVQSPIDSFINASLEFYKTAGERDRHLIENTLKEFSKLQTEQSGIHGSTPRLVVLVTGGFHTSGLSEEMKKRGIGYAVIQPNIVKIDNGENYHNTLRDKNADLSAYFDQHSLSKQEALFLKGILETAVPLLWEKGKVSYSRIGLQIAKAINRHPVLSKCLWARAKSSKDSSSMKLSLKSTKISNQTTATSFGVQGEPTQAVIDAVLSGMNYRFMRQPIGRDGVFVGTNGASADTIFTFGPALGNGMRVRPLMRSVSRGMVPRRPEKPQSPAVGEQKLRSEMRQITWADIQPLVEEAKDEWASVEGIGAARREEGYQTAMARLAEDTGQKNSQEVFLEILNHPFIAADQEAVKQMVRLAAFGKGHTIQRFLVLSDEGKKNFINDLKVYLRFHLVKAETLHQKYIVRKEPPFRLNVTPETVEAPKTITIDENLPADYPGMLTPAQRAEYEAAGRVLFESGQVGIVQPAGGTGARLNYPHPKGLFPLSLIEKKPLFITFASQMRAMEERYGRPIPWVVMTSEAGHNHEKTTRFFEEGITRNGNEVRFFGLQDIEAVVFPKQRELPTMQDNGELIVRPSPMVEDKLTKHLRPYNPENDGEAPYHEGEFEIGGFGHGDMNDYILRDKEVMEATWFVKDLGAPRGYRRMDGKLNVYQWLKGKGVEYLQFIQVDNLLAIAQPVAFGVHLASYNEIKAANNGVFPANVEHATPIIVAKYPTEKVGMVAQVEGKDVILEYNQVPSDTTYITYAYVIQGMPEEKEPILLQKIDDRIVTCTFDEWTTQLETFKQEFVRKHHNEPLKKDIEDYHQKHLVELEKQPSSVTTIWHKGHRVDRSRLLLWLRNGNLNAHIWTFDTLNWQGELPVVVDQGKKVHSIGPDGSFQEYARNKFEIHVFNAPKKGVVMETTRPEGFAPIKSPVVDTPEEAAALIAEHNRRLLRKAGYQLQLGADTSSDIPLKDKVDLPIVNLDASVTGYDDFENFRRRVGTGKLDPYSRLLLRVHNLHTGSLLLADSAQFIITALEPYKAQVSIGQNVTVNSGVKIRITIQGNGTLTIEDGYVFTHDMERNIMDGETYVLSRAEVRAPRGGLLSRREMLKLAVGSALAGFVHLGTSWVQAAVPAGQLTVPNIKKGYLRLNLDFNYLIDLEKKGVMNLAVVPKGARTVVETTPEIKYANVLGQAFRNVLPDTQGQPKMLSVELGSKNVTSSKLAEQIAFTQPGTEITIQSLTFTAEPPPGSTV
ncbi:MAG: UTP--glucose-1-phosphate uridylyltransferase, partial [Candidatus Omnitrophica bacterium]|nr:UTP--glucose-1-phosphate uridylyltransferase [Candidatus Omnitrophota bacterium]